MSAGQRVRTYSAAVALLASLSLHASALLLLASSNRAYEFDFDIVLPNELELGLSEAMPSVQTPGDGAEPHPPPPKHRAASTAASPEPEPEPAESEASEEAPERDDAAEPAEEQDTEEEPAPLPVAPPSIEGEPRIPPGAQLALRLDLKRVRESPLASDVSRLVEAIPDWHMILGGSGIHPVQDLDRLLLASPNLERSKLVVAGRHRRKPSFAAERVAALAESRGKRARWRTRYGVRTATWHNRDATPRTIALLGPRTFSITRNEDLARVLAMAKARELRDPKEEGLVAARGAEALLSMGPEEVLSVEIEGARRFIVGNSRYIPVRARLAVVETGAKEATVHLVATYDSPDEAREAAQYWQRVADHYAGHLWLSLAGFSSSFRSLRLEEEEERVRIRFRLGHDQIRVVLSYLEGRLQSGARHGHEKRGQKAPF